MHALRRLWFAKVTAQLVEKLREIVAGGVNRTTEGPRRFRITSGGATEAEINPAGK